MLVHRRVTPSIKFAGTHLYTWVERGTVKVKCLVLEHNTIFSAKVRTKSRVHSTLKLTRLHQKNHSVRTQICLVVKTTFQTKPFIPNEFDLHENDHVTGTHFLMKTRFDNKVPNNSEIVYKITCLCNM